jgi:hypothetical protein
MVSVFMSSTWLRLSGGAFSAIRAKKCHRGNGTDIKIGHFPSRLAISVRSALYVQTRGPRLAQTGGRQPPQKLDNGSEKSIVFPEHHGRAKDGGIGKGCLHCQLTSMVADANMSMRRPAQEPLEAGATEVDK